MDQHEPSFAERILAETAIVYDLRVRTGERERYYILQLKPALHKAFLKLLNNDEGFRIKDYGDILFSGEGEPPDGLKDMLRKKYGMYEEE